MHELAIIGGSTAGFCLKGVRGGVKQVAVPPKWDGKAEKGIVDALFKN